MHDAQGTARGQYQLDLSLTADPYLYGAEVTLASGQVVNDPGVSTANLLERANLSSFETDVTAWNSQGTSPPTRAQSATHVAVGAQAMLVTWTGGGGIPFVRSTVTGLTVGATYTLTAQGWATAGGPNWKVGVEGIAQGADVTTKGPSPPAPTRSSATATSHNITVNPSSASTAGTVWIDNVQLLLNGATTALQLALPDVVGDAPTPANVTVTPGHAPTAR